MVNPPFLNENGVPSGTPFLLPAAGQAPVYPVYNVYNIERPLGAGSHLPRRAAFFRQVLRLFEFSLRKPCIAFAIYI